MLSRMIGGASSPHALRWLGAMSSSSPVRYLQCPPGVGVGVGVGVGGEGHGRVDEGQEVDSACAPLRRLAGVSSSACPSLSSFLCLARPRRKES